MKEFKIYIVSFFSGLASLLKGMRVTLRVFFRSKVTECYPENRSTLRMADRFRGELVLTRNEDGALRCVACGICQNACPNQTIEIISAQVATPEGKNKKVLDKYMYDLGSCTFCQLCVISCPYDAITFDTKFEHALFTRSKLLKQLNAPAAQPIR